MRRTPTQTAAATARLAARRVAAADEVHDAAEATLRERALNAEAALTQAQAEIRTQRRQAGELMGQIRDLDQSQIGESVERLVTEDANLKQQFRQPTNEHRAIQERLEVARSNNRFADRQIAELKARLLDIRRPNAAPDSVRNIDKRRAGKPSKLPEGRLGTGSPQCGDATHEQDTVRLCAADGEPIGVGEEA